VNRPSFLIDNWRANNLHVTNLSINDNTPIRIQMIGPGIPGTSPRPLHLDGRWLALRPGAAAEAMTIPIPWRLLVRNTSGSMTDVVVIGGPLDASANNGYAVEVNAGAITGPPTTVPPPPGFYATTTDNAYTFPLSWGSSTLFVVNLSPHTAAPAEVALIAQ
jgi:hypothetical protein